MVPYIYIFTDMYAIHLFKALIVSVVQEERKRRVRVALLKTSTIPDGYLLGNFYDKAFGH